MLINQFKDCHSYLKIQIKNAIIVCHVGFKCVLEHVQEFKARKSDILKYSKL
jgi:hypothetical protein